MPNASCKLQESPSESEVEHIDISNADYGFDFNHNSEVNNEHQVRNAIQSNNVSPLNSTSFTISRLAALDAKYSHLNKPIEKIDLNAVLASVSPYKCQMAKHQPAQNQVVRSQKAETQSIMNRTMDTQTIERLAFDNQSIRNQPSRSQQVATQSAKNLKFNTQSIRDRSMQNKTSGAQLIQDQTVTNQTKNVRPNICDDDSVGVLTQNNCYISVDKNVLAFGFVDGDTTHEISVKITNDSDEPIWLQPFIVHSEQFDQKLLGFRLKNTNSFSLDPKASRFIDVEFTPKAIKTYNGQLRLRLMSKDEPEFVVQMFGYGARARLDVYTRNFQKITMCADEIGICDLDRSMKEVELILANSGKRDAFVHIKAVNSSNQSLSSEMITIVPNRVIVRKSTQEYAKIKITFNHSASAKTPTRSSLHFPTNSSSNMTRAKTLQNESMARLQIAWGEERQRMRLKEYLKQNAKESNSKSVVQYVAKHFDGEHDSRNEKIVGNWDLSRFLGSVRLMTIQFVNTHVQPKGYSGNAFSRQVSSVSPNSSGDHRNQTLASTMSGSVPKQQNYSPISSGTVEDTILLSGSKAKYRSA